jgi:hypothetical protein
MRHLLIAAMMLGSANAGQLRITVYDQAHLPKAVRQAAFDYLRQIFYESGIEIDSVAGDPAAEEASLTTYLAVPRKGLENDAACRARRDIALEILPATAATRHSTILGMAIPLARNGLNTRVFDDRIRDAARDRHRAHEVVLAHAIAHEIGHVLLRTNAHSRRGLMSGVWTDHEYGWIAKNLMFFSGEQSQLMRATLSGAGCPSSPRSWSAGAEPPPEQLPVN